MALAEALKPMAEMVLGADPPRIPECRRGQQIRLVRFAECTPRPETASGFAGLKIACLLEQVLPAS
jgi:hypothetical protein